MGTIIDDGILQLCGLLEMVFKSELLQVSVEKSYLIYGSETWPL